VQPACRTQDGNNVEMRRFGKHICRTAAFCYVPLPSKNADGFAAAGSSTESRERGKAEPTSFGARNERARSRARDDDLVLVPEWDDVHLCPLVRL